MRTSSYLIKPASSICNMSCQYCFYSDVSKQRKDYSKGIMAKETVELLIDKALNDAQEITFSFQGGEPTMAGLNYFVHFVEYVEKIKKNHIIHYSIQTNGYCLNDEWISFFDKYQFLVGISLDGYKNIHDQVRLKGAQPTFDKIINHIQKLQQRNIDYNILTVVTSQMVLFAKEIYKFYKEQGFQYIQFIPCLPELDHSTEQYNLNPKDFYHFYHDIFELWYEDLKHGHYISISFFEDLLMIFQGRYPRTCGMLGKCQIQLVIEGDGAVYPCDFYALDQYCLGNITVNNIDELRQFKSGQIFLKEEKRTSSICKECQFKNICHGQCKRMNIVYFDDNYCGYQEFLKETYQIFYSIGQGKIR